MTPKHRRLLQQLMLQCCCGQGGSPGSGAIDVPPHGSMPTSPGIPIENCCFCPAEDGSTIVPPRMHLDWFDGCIGPREAILEFGPLVGPRPIPSCFSPLQWSFLENFDDPNPNPLTKGLLFCNPSDPLATYGFCCADNFSVECLPNGKCFVLRATRTRQYVGGLSIGGYLAGIKLNVLSCKPFLAVFNQPFDTTFFDPTCNYTFANPHICPRCAGVPCFGVVSEA